MDQTDELKRLAQRTFETYVQTRAFNDLELSIQSFKQVLDLIPGDHPSRAICSLCLAACYSARYERLKVLSDLDSAIQYGQHAVDLGSSDVRKQAVQLHDLGTNYRNKYLQLRVVSDLEAAIQFHQQAVELTPEMDLLYASRVSSLAFVHNEKYERFGVLSSLEAMIKYSQQAVDFTQDDDDPERILRLNNLGNAYGSRYEKLGALSDLEAAFQCHQQAVDLTSADDHNRIARLNNLSLRYTSRYDQLGALSDLEVAMQYHQEAFVLASDNNRDRGLQSHILGTGYIRRYERLEAPSDLEAAIQLFQEAIDLMTENHPQRAIRLSSLGRAYGTLYERTKALNDLEISRQHFQEALNITPEDHPVRASLLQNLGVIYGSLYDQTKVLDNLDRCIQLSQEALNLSPKEHGKRAVLLQNLGLRHWNRFQRTEVPTDRKLFFRNFQEALNEESSPPSVRLIIGRDLFQAYAEAKNWSMAYSVVSQTVSLISLSNSRFLERSDIQHRIDISIVGLSSEATAVALRTGKSVYEAMQSLEVGRSIIVTSLGDLRADITELNKKIPHLAEEFNRLRDLLDIPKESRKDSQRYNTGKQLEKLIEKIRSSPDFDRFLLGPSENELREAATCGAIIIVNVSDYGCHALIIEQKGFRALELPLLNTKDIRTRADKLSDLDIETLEWLWDTIAHPVLSFLNLVKTPQHTWPRVWWILTGPLVRFPIHAAGCYSEGESETHATVMDRVISSYSPSVRAIVDAYRKKSVPATLPKESMILVGMPETLSFAQKEIDMLAKIGTSMQLQVKQPRSLKEETLLAMKGCKIFHFAGHGHTDLLEPSNSALLLSDGRLTVDSIFDINLHQDKPFLAYLSACGTGQIKHEELIDEGLHLVSAFQLAGFRHVIGTLWEVNDESCVEVARTTYEWMQKQGLSDESVSEGLHHACRKLRSQWIQENDKRAASRRDADAVLTQEQSSSARTEARVPRDVTGVEELPLHWVPYIHYGV